MKISEHLSASVLLYGYAVFLGAAYLFSFWRPFGFSVFPYLSLQDYINAPLNRVVVLIAVPLLSLPLLLQSLRFDDRVLRTFLVGLFIGYSALVAYYFFDAVRLFLHHPFHYRNEMTVLIVIAILAAVSWFIAFEERKSPQVSRSLVVALSLLQSSTVVAAGYKDGKAIYIGAAEVHFLQTTAICESNGQRPWVFLGRFTDSSIFMNTIDKRLCITEETSYTLVPRKVAENL